MTDAEKLKIAVEFIRDLSERGGGYAEEEWDSGYLVAESGIADEASKILERIK